jgi:FMN phosphatase YigB (HAD superfamily)
MSKPIIAVDADDTLFDENTAVRLFHNAKYGTSHTADDYLRPGAFDTFWEHIWNTDKPETIRRYEEFIDYKLEHPIPPLPGALEAVQKLKQQYELVIVTSRDQRAVDMTHRALLEHYPNVFQDVHFVSLWGKGEKATKATICEEIGAAYLIDDSYEHCLLVAEAGIRAIVFGRYGWNRTQALGPGMVRAENWQAVLEYFDARG